jgi:hypothetical protein
MRLICAIFFVSLLPFSVSAQIVIKAGTQFGMQSNPDIVVQATGNITNNSTVDFSETNLLIDLAGADQTVTGNLTVNGLRLSGAGNKTIAGNLTVRQALQFQAGFLIPQSGKILYTGTTENLSESEDSYVKGIFYQAGTGARKFPIGTASAFAPMLFTDVKTNEEIGVEVIEGDAGLIPDVGMLSISPLRYWKITMADVTQIPSIDSRVAVGLNGITIPIDNAPAVVQAADLATQAVSLGNFSNTDNYVTSRDPVSAPIIGIALTTEILVKVHDLITPFDTDPEQVNNTLYVENIERFPFRRVTLLDRWGVQVKQWERFENDNVQFDFATLSPGNYICVVEYGEDETGKSTQKITQMVTVLKTN